MAGKKPGPKKGEGGRPPIVLTDDQRAQVEAHAQYVSQEVIADSLGVVRLTFARMLERDEELNIRYKRGKARASIKVAKSLIEQAMKGNIAAAIFYCKTQLGWRETLHVDNTSSDGSMSPATVDVSKLSMAVLKEIRAAGIEADEDQSD